MRSLLDIKTVFVLSGGANPGAVQVGMLYAMLESGIHPYQAGRSGDWQKLKCTASQGAVSATICWISVSE